MVVQQERDAAVLERLAAITGGAVLSSAGSAEQMPQAEAPAQDLSCQQVPHSMCS